MKRYRRAASTGETGRRRRALGLATLAALLLLGTPPSTARAQFSVRPAVLDFEDSGERVVIVRNESDDPLIFRLYPGDLGQSRGGTHRFFPSGSQESSCHERLVVYPDRIAVDPGAEAAARIRLDAGGEPCWSVVFVEHRPTVVERGGRAIGRVAVQILSTGIDPRRDASVQDVAVESGSEGGFVRYVFHNLGDVPLRPHGRLEIRTLDGDVVSSVRLEPFGALPRHARDRRVALPPGLPPGPLLAVPILDFGADHLVAGQTLFDHAE